MSPAAPRPYRLFEVVGLELEYPIVDASLTPLAVVEDALRLVHGRPTSDAEYRNIGYGNELAAHVFEIKTLHPQRSLVRAERELVASVRHIAKILDRELGARLLPTGMHPFMQPGEAKLWRRAGQRIYRTYDRIFGTRGHGWLNVQATHVNLPFGTERETVLLHNAIACLLPYLPAISASSPMVEGDFGPDLDNRLRFYQSNQSRMPMIAGDVIPEFVSSYRDYRSRILERIYQALEGIPGGEVLRHEWVNSRGAIVRFMRRAIEIRVLDTQECVKADIAIAAFIRGALRWMVRELDSGRMRLPNHGVLVDDFNRVIARGRWALVAAPHLSASSAPRPASSNQRPAPSAQRTAHDVLQQLLERTADHLSADERPYLDIIQDRLENGSLAERIVAAVKRRAPRAGARRRSAIAEIYRELADCLIGNRVREPT